MKKVFLSLFAVLVIIGVTNAQQKGANISFETEVHDFGKIKEDAGKVEYKFNFTNTGDAPLIINNVRTSCGCTSPTWTEKPVMPGQKGYVSAVFDPWSRPAKFDKTISVESNSAGNSRITLRITGDVIAREKTVEDTYPKTIGDLRLENDHFAFIKVYNNQVKIDTLKIFNSSDSKMKVEFTEMPEYLKLTAFPKEIKPGGKGYILGEYNGMKVNDWGFITDRVKVSINGNSGGQDYLTISAKIEEDFSKLTKAEKENAPKIKFDDRIFSFGKISKTDKIEHEFKFTNEGKSDLVIHKIRSSCTCTIVAPQKTTIKPGESSSFKAVYTPGSSTGVQRKSIYVITNDPNNVETRLMISGEIITE